MYQEELYNRTWYIKQFVTIRVPWEPKSQRMIGCNKWAGHINISNLTLGLTLCFCWLLKQSRERENRKRERERRKQGRRREIRICGWRRRTQRGKINGKNLGTFHSSFTYNLLVPFIDYNPTGLILTTCWFQQILTNLRTDSWSLTATWSCWLIMTILPPSRNPCPHRKIKDQSSCPLHPLPHSISTAALVCIPGLEWICHRDNNKVLVSYKFPFQQ